MGGQRAAFLQRDKLYKQRTKQLAKTHPQPVSTAVNVVAALLVDNGVAQFKINLILFIHVKREILTVLNYLF